jgi:hypothetical protein
MQFVVIAFLLVCVAMMVTLQLAKARTHRRRSVSGEGKAPLFLSREEWPAGRGEKIGDNLCGRDDSCDQHYRATQHIRRKPMITLQSVNSSLGKRAFRLAISLSWHRLTVIIELLRSQYVQRSDTIVVLSQIGSCSDAVGFK